MVQPLVVKQTPALPTSNPTSGCYRREMKTWPHEDFFKNVTDSLTYPSPKLETTQVSIETDGQMVLHLHSGNQCSNEKGQALPESHRPSSNRAESDTGEFALYDSTHAKLKISGDEDESSVCFWSRGQNGLEGQEEAVGSEGITLGLGRGAGYVGACSCQNPLSCTVRPCAYYGCGRGCEKSRRQAFLVSVTGAFSEELFLSKYTVTSIPRLRVTLQINLCVMPT